MKPYSKFVWERFATAIKIDRIPLFDVQFSSVSVIEQTGRFLARGGARVKLQLQVFVRSGKSRLKTAPTIYNSARYHSCFFFRFDWTLAASGCRSLATTARLAGDRSLQKTISI